MKLVPPVVKPFDLAGLLHAPFSPNLDHSGDGLKIGVRSVRSTDAGFRAADIKQTASETELGRFFDKDGRTGQLVHAAGSTGSQPSVTGGDSAHDEACHANLNARLLVTQVILS